MPSLYNMDTAYTSAPVGVGPDNLGYLLRVVAVADSTQVSVAGLLSPLLLDAGQHVELLTNTSRQVVKVKYTRFYYNALQNVSSLFIMRYKKALTFFVLYENIEHNVSLFFKLI